MLPPSAYNPGFCDELIQSCTLLSLWPTWTPLCVHTFQLTVDCITHNILPYSPPLACNAGFRDELMQSCTLLSFGLTWTPLCVTKSNLVVD